MTELTDDELRAIDRCVECEGSGKRANMSTCRTCFGTGRVRVNLQELDELIRAKCKAAWRNGERSGFARGTRFARQGGMGAGLIPDPDPNPFAKGDR